METLTGTVGNDLTFLWAAFLQLLPMLSVGLLCMAAFALIARPMARWLLKPIGYFSSNNLIRSVIQRCIQVLIILLGVYIFLRLAGLTHFAVAIVSGTGLMGIILGFAFRDIAENFISSLLLSVQRPFRLGDVIDVAGHTGIVEKVTTRATTLVDFDGNHIQIPNATIYKSVIRNLTANPRMRGYFSIGIGYDSGIRQAQALAMKIMANHDAVLTDPEPQILISELASSTVNLDIYFWINSEAHSLLKVQSQLMRLVLREFESQGLSMPDDARERILLRNVRSDVDRDSPRSAPKGEAAGNAILREDREMDHEADLSSDAGDIREQAAASRDPESGKNII